MAPVEVKPDRVRSFETEALFERWLSTHHDKEAELWLLIHKKGSGLPSVSYAEAVKVALCWGWIDGLRKAFDERSFLQRFTPRRSKSIWSQINRVYVERLIQEGRMRPPGAAQVAAAKADGRWGAAYAPPSTATVPSDLLAAIDADPRARATFATLDRQNLFALSFRMQRVSTPAGRARAIARYVALLARGETLHAMVRPRPAKKKPEARRTPPGAVANARPARKKKKNKT